MKIIRNILTDSLLICFLGYFTSCERDEDYDYFRIQVDSVYIPEPVFANQPFEVEFYGYIGHNGCYSFSEFVSEKQSKTIQVEAWGKLNFGSKICADVMVGLRGEKLNILINEPGNYRLLIKQPDGTFLERQILVE